MRLVAFAVISCLAASGCAKMQADKREAQLRHLYAQHGVLERPFALDEDIKRQCHARIQRDIIAYYTYPDTWEPFRELAPMEKATHAYATRTGYTLPDEGDTEEALSPDHTIFYMTEYLGQDFIGSGTARQYVCTVRADASGLHLEAVASREGFRRVMNLPDTEPAAW